MSSDTQEREFAQRLARSLTERFVESGLVGAFGIDALAAVGLSLIGVGIWQLLPVAVWIYAGLVVLLLAFALGRTRSGGAGEVN